MKANLLAQVASFSLMSALKLLTYPFYRFEVNWLSRESSVELDKVRLIVLLNHTSLYEALFVRLGPFRLLWRIAGQLMVPVADITVKRPVVGRFFYTLLPGLTPISRKRDDSWQTFLERIDQEAIVAILPEGRMRRRDGRDKFGKPMSVRAGVADIIETLEEGNILFVYSGGLHHVQIPGQKFPRLFKRIKANMELVDISDYKSQYASDDARKRKLAYVADIERRLEVNTPYCEQQPYNQKLSD